MLGTCDVHAYLDRAGPKTILQVGAHFGCSYSEACNATEAADGVVLVRMYAGDRVFGLERHRTPRSPKIKVICATCGSGNVKRDAWAEWDSGRQEWVLSQTFDDAHCDDCDGSTRLDEVPL